MNPEWEVSVEQVHEMRSNGARLFLIDCRTEKERAIAMLDRSVLVPLDEFASRAADLVDDIEDDHHVVIYCHHGRRSLTAAALLRSAGVERAMSMAGGIDAWSKKIDPGVKVY